MVMPLICKDNIFTNQKSVLLLAVLVCWCVCVGVGCLYIKKSPKKKKVSSWGSICIVLSAAVLYAHASKLMFQEKMCFCVDMLFGSCQRHIRWCILPVMEKCELLRAESTCQWCRQCVCRDLFCWVDFVCACGDVPVHGLEHRGDVKTKKVSYHLQKHDTCQSFRSTIALL